MLQHPVSRSIEVFRTQKPTRCNFRHCRMVADCLELARNGGDLGVVSRCAISKIIDLVNRMTRQIRNLSTTPKLRSSNSQTNPIHRKRKIMQFNDVEVHTTRLRVHALNGRLSQNEKCENESISDTLAFGMAKMIGRRLASYLPALFV